MVMLPSPFKSSHNLTSGWRTAHRPNHDGEDYGMPVGTSLYAIFDGVVTFSGVDQWGGVYIDMASNDKRWKTRYLHNSTNLKKWGDKVSKGELVAYSGNTGNSTGPHLHIVLWKDGVEVRPSDFIKFNTINMQKLKELEESNKRVNDTYNGIRDRINKLFEQDKYNPIDSKKDNFGWFRGLMWKDNKLDRVVQALLDDLLGKQEKIDRLQGVIESRDNEIKELKKLQPKVADYESEIAMREGQVRELQELNSGLEAKLKEKPDKFQFLPIWRSLMRDAYIQSFVGGVITLAVGYVTSQVPELQEYSAGIVNALLAVLGINAGGKHLVNTVKEAKKPKLEKNEK